VSRADALRVHEEVHIVILAYPGADELDLFGAYAPLGKAAGHQPGVRPTLTVAIAAANRVVPCANGARIYADVDLDAVRTATAVVLPGGHGVHAAGRDGRHTAAVADAYRAGAHLYAVCSGSFLIAAAGLARSRVLATHALKQQQLASAGSCTAVGGLVRDGRICSIGGSRGRGAKGVELAFQILRDWRPDAVDLIATRLEIDPGPPAGERTADQLTSTDEGAEP